MERQRQASPTTWPVTYGPGWMVSLGCAAEKLGLRLASGPARVFSFVGFYN